MRFLVWGMTLLVVFINLINAEEIKNVSKFTPNGNLTQGDMVKISVQLWPVENYDEKTFLNLKDKIFLDHFYVVDIKATRSENNYDVILLDVDAIVESPAPAKKSIKLEFAPYVTTVNLPFEIKKLEGFDGQFVILNQAVDYVSKNLLLVIFVALLLVVSILILIFRKKVTTYLNRNSENNKIRIHFQTLFHNAKERKHFEEIYLRKSEWLVFIPEKSQALNVFFKTMEDHQYKKNWSKEELFEVKDAFDKIRGGIK